jgi:hypothetical protein
MVVVCCLLIHLLQYFGFVAGVWEGSLILGPFSISNITLSSYSSTSSVTVLFVIVPVAETVLEPN